MCGNVSRVLQTRETIKIGRCFRKFHYNRDFNTNAHPLLSVHSDSFCVASQERRKNDLLPKLFGFRSWASNTSLTKQHTSFRVVFVSVAARAAALATFCVRIKMDSFVTNYCVPWHASVNPIICDLNEILRNIPKRFAPSLDGVAFSRFLAFIIILFRKN